MDTSESSFLHIYVTPDQVVDEVGRTYPSVGQTVGQPVRQVRPESQNGEVQRRKPHPAAYVVALEMVEGDFSRLQIEPDGGVIILNQSRYKT